MSEIRHPEVKVQLVGEDGNVFSIIGRVSRALRRAGVPRAELDEFQAEVTSQDSYHAALGVVMRWVDAS